LRSKKITSETTEELEMFWENALCLAFIILRNEADKRKKSAWRLHFCTPLDVAELRITGK